MYKILITSPTAHTERSCDTDEELNDLMERAAKCEEGLCQITVLKKVGRPSKWSLFFSMSFTKEASEHALKQRMKFNG